MKLWWQFAFCPVQFLVTWILLIKSVTLHGLCSLGLFFHPGVSFPSIFLSNNTLCVHRLESKPHGVLEADASHFQRRLREADGMCGRLAFFKKVYFFLPLVKWKHRVTHKEIDIVWT